MTQAWVDESKVAVVSLRKMCADMYEAGETFAAIARACGRTIAQVQYIINCMVLEGAIERQVRHRHRTRRRA